MFNNTHATRANDIALRIFINLCQRRAHQIVDNQHAGTTLDEQHFITKYFRSHRAQSLSLAITQCTCAMLDVYRRSELPRA